jgi:amidase
VTSDDLTLCLLGRIKHYDGTLRSYTEINPRCLEEARIADYERAAGKARGPLHGVPMNLKDNIGTAAPMHTTAGAEILLNHSPARDAAIVTQLRQAGVVILGKASLSELAGTLTSPGYNAVSGNGINPYGKGLPVSGSSSGSAISINACLTVVSVGSETSGSLVSPGSMNGVVAMKPSLNLVSGDGIVPLVRFQDSAGPMARNVIDAAILLSVMDSAETDYAATLDAKALDGISVGFLRADISRGKNPPRNAEWLALIEEGLRKANAVSHDVTIEGKVELLPVIFLGLAHDTIGYMTAAGAPVQTLAGLQSYNAARPEIRIPRGQNLIEMAVPLVTTILDKEKVTESESGKLYEKLAIEARNRAADMLAKVFAKENVEVLVSLSNTHSESYATAGYPAITVPLGLNEAGAPNGVTFIGKPGEDAKVLAYAFAFEQATRYRRNPVNY